MLLLHPQSKQKNDEIFSKLDNLIFNEIDEGCSDDDIDDEFE